MAKKSLADCPHAPVDSKTTGRKSRFLALHASSYLSICSASRTAEGDSLTCSEVCISASLNNHCKVSQFAIPSRGIFSTLKSEEKRRRRRRKDTESKRLFNFNGAVVREYRFKERLFVEIRLQMQNDSIISFLRSPM